MTHPYRTAPVASLPELRTDRCPWCGEEGLSVDDHTAAQLVTVRHCPWCGEEGLSLVTVRPCSWWRRLLGCREDRPHVHCQHGRCGWRWTAAPAGHR